MFLPNRISKKEETVAVLDLGTRRTRCFIGQKDETFGVRVLGYGDAESDGMKSGVVIDMALAERSIRAAVQEAERSAGVAVRAVSVNVSTRTLRSQHLNVQTQFSSGAVADRDLKRVIKSSLEKLARPDHAIIHALPLNWSVDAEKGISDPRGMYGTTLGVDMHFVVAPIGPLRNLAHCIERSHLQISSVTVSPYAAGLAVLTDDERDLGATVIDMGCGLTTMAVFRNNALIHVDVLTIGSGHITTDLARGLTTPNEAAERIKKLYGSGLHGVNDERSMIPCPPAGAQDMLHYEPQTLVTNIVRKRVEEIFELLKNRLYAAGIDQYVGPRIVLTGGGAELNGICELAEYIFNKRTRIGQPHGVLGLSEEQSNAGAAVGVGLLKHAFIKNNEAISGLPDLSGRHYLPKRYAGGNLDRTLQWLRANL